MMLVRAGDDGGWEPNQKEGWTLKRICRAWLGVAGAVVPHGIHYVAYYMHEVKCLAQNTSKKEAGQNACFL